jgi:RsiW-degrading membrane proteinase PrsW (M82 family)
MGDNSSDLLQLHDSNAEALRHSSDVIWRFAIAIVTLQGAALGLFAQAGLHQSIGKWVLVGGFLLAVFFSMMLNCGLSNLTRQQAVLSNGRDNRAGR